MRIKISDYIANLLIEYGITTIFTVTGGGAMHLNDSFGHHESLHCVYNHHEQASAIAAEAYARLNNRIAAVCVTSGPGATNALTGCLCGYMGSIPMLIISGQVRYPLTVRYSGLNLRTLGEQEYDICRSASGMTKYFEMITDPYMVKFCFEKALFIATHGRPGPVWLDIPLDIQGAVIDTDLLADFDPIDCFGELPPPVTSDVADIIINKVKSARRPVLYAGLGVRLSDAYGDFLELVEKLNIPVVTGMTSVDYLQHDHRLFAGRTGVTGDRAGNYAVQNSDLFFSIGSRLSFKQTGFNTETWARGAYKIMVDIDPEELKKEHLKIDMPVWADAGELIRKVNSKITAPLKFDNFEWVLQCRQWVDKYPVVKPEHYMTADGKANIYAFYNELSKTMTENGILVTTSGTSRVVGRQAFLTKKGQRFITNHATSPMGYCLPAAIGVCIANGKNSVILVTGEGGFQMNIQELQTIVHNRLPIKIIVISNGGYHSIRMTQKAFFGNNSHVGIGDGSGDLSFPDLKKIANAYGIIYFQCNNNDDLPEVLEELLNFDSYAICEVIVTMAQGVEPKAASKKLENGKMVSAPLEDMAPFLARKELKSNMHIPIVDRE